MAKLAFRQSPAHDVAEDTKVVWLGLWAVVAILAIIWLTLWLTGRM